MLRQEDPHFEPDHSTAASTRVTAEELARAVAALEARKESEARRMDGTISIGEAVQELELDATPEEVYAEVQAQRAAAQPLHYDVPPATEGVTPPAVEAPTPPLHQTITSALREAAAAATPGLKEAARAATPALKHGMDALSQHASKVKEKSHRQKRRGEKIVTIIGIGFALLGISSGAFFSQGGFGHTPSILRHVSQSASTTRPLSAVPDEQTVSCSTAAVQQLLQGTPPSKVMVQDDDLDNGWQLIKYDGRIYLRGYILPTSDDALQVAPVHIYNDDNAGELYHITQKDITVPLDGLTFDHANNNGDWTELFVSHLKPDSHLYEDW